MTLSISIGEIPSPGRSIFKWASLIVVPAEISEVKCILFLAAVLLFISDKLGSFLPEPLSAISIFRIEATIAFNSNGSNDAL